MFNVDPNMLMPLVLGATHHEDMMTIVYCSSLFRDFGRLALGNLNPASVFTVNYTVPK